jgi:hypothetical protein
MKTGEAKVKDDVKKYLTSIGAYFIMPVGVGYGKRMIDIYACVRGKFVGIETKKPRTATARAFQEKIMEDIRKASGLAFKADSVDDAIRIIGIPPDVA